MSIQDELRSLNELRESRAISDEEYERLKAQLLNAPSPHVGQAAYLNVDQQTRQWAMILHLSQFAGYVVPVAGWIAPIVIWQVKKTELPGIDAHGKVVVNWLLSGIVYAFICFILLFLIIGIPLFVALCAVAIIFPIVGGIKANNGELWRYPMSIQFFK